MMFRLARIAGIIRNRVMITFGPKPLFVRRVQAVFFCGDNICPFFY